jgi:hypothetical protein
MTYPPPAMPAAPRPWIARPIIRAILFGERAQTRLPISKTEIAMMYTTLKEKYL